MFSSTFNNAVCNIKRFEPFDFFTTYDYGFGYSFGYETTYGDYGYTFNGYDFFNNILGDFEAITENLNCRFEPKSEPTENLEPNQSVVGLYNLFIDGTSISINETDVVEIDGKDYEIKAVQRFVDRRLGYTQILLKDKNKNV